LAMQGNQNDDARRAHIASQICDALYDELCRTVSMPEDFNVVARMVCDRTSGSVAVGILKEFIPIYYHYLMARRLGHQPPFRTFEAHEYDFLLAQFALPADEARTFSGSLPLTLMVSFEKFKDWWVPSDNKFSFCEALEIIELIWANWNSDIQQPQPGAWNFRTVHGFISGTMAKALLSDSRVGTFLVRFGSAGGVTVDLKNAQGRMEKKNVSVAQLRERPLQRWLHEMDGAAALMYVHNALNLEVAKSVAFPHAADRSGYEMPLQATFGDESRKPATAAAGAGGYENVPEGTAPTKFSFGGYETSVE